MKNNQDRNPLSLTCNPSLIETCVFCGVYVCTRYIFEIVHSGYTRDTEVHVSSGTTMLRDFVTLSFCYVKSSSCISKRACYCQLPIGVLLLHVECGRGPGTRGAKQFMSEFSCIETRVRSVCLRRGVRRQKSHRTRLIRSPVPLTQPSPCLPLADLRLHEYSYTYARPHGIDLLISRWPRCPAPLTCQRHPKSRRPSRCRRARRPRMRQTCACRPPP